MKNIPGKKSKLSKLTKHLMFNCEQEIIKVRERDTKKEEANKKKGKICKGI